jgi:uncharacterized membrane protein
MNASESHHPMSPAAEKALSYVVLGGAVISVILFLVGIVIASATSSLSDADKPMTLQDIADSITSLNAIGIIGIGVIVVIATPLIRIVSTIVYFSGADRRLVALPIITLALIILGFIIRL